MSEDKFELTSDQRDSLRIETQSISPKEKAELEKAIIDSHRLLLKEFGNHISNKKDDKDVINAFFFTERYI